MKVSVIIPAYNVEEYIEDTIKSLLKQSHYDFEAIFVNDGSTDRTESIIAMYAEKDARIILHTINNSGVTNARCEGYLLSTGDYITFVDGDDLLLPNSLEILLSSFSSTAIDIVVSGYLLLSSQGDYIEDVKYISKVSNNETYMEFVLSEGNQGTPWGRAFRRTVISREAFDIPKNITVREDAIMNLRIATKVDCVSFISDLTYCYRVRPGSAITCKKNIKYFIDYYHYLFSLLNKEGINNPSIKSKAGKYCLAACLDVLMQDIKKFNWTSDHDEVMRLINKSSINWKLKERIKIVLLNTYVFKFLMKCLSN